MSIKIRVKYAQYVNPHILTALRYCGHRYVQILHLIAECLVLIALISWSQHDGGNTATNKYSSCYRMHCAGLGCGVFRNLNRLGLVKTVGSIQVSTFWIISNLISNDFVWEEAGTGTLHSLSFPLTRLRNLKTFGFLRNNGQLPPMNNEYPRSPMSHLWFLSIGDCPGLSGSVQCGHTMMSVWTVVSADLQVSA